MSVEYDHSSTGTPIVGDPRGLVTTIEEADEARRHAAEIGDYVMAQRWLWHERQLADQEAEFPPPIAGTSGDRRHDPVGDRPESPS